jgi:hypothetical protein
LGTPRGLRNYREEEGNANEEKADDCGFSELSTIGHELATKNSTDLARQEILDLGLPGELPWRQSTEDAAVIYFIQGTA